MFDASQISPADAPTLQRVRGAARVSLGAGGLERLHQSGSAKAMLPRMHGAAPEVVFLNTAGGLTGGDVLDFALHVGAGARAVGTTQTAERAYASAGGTAQVEVALSVGVGARLDWLPQETILFDRSALRRRTRAELTGDAAFLGIETLVLGRAAHGEVLRQVALDDRREITRDGVPVLVDPLRLTGAVLARAGGAAVLGGARAAATLALVAPGAADALAPAREVLARHPGIEAAASGWDGRLVVRALAGDLWPLRRAMADLIARLRGGPRPRVWQM